MIFFWQGTGLLSYLLRIRSPEDLRFHAQYGGILESYVISEFLKCYMNSGEEHSIYFWRDSTGNEIDILIDEGIILTPVEIKAGQTVASDFFKGICFWKKLTAEIGQGAALIYGGDKSYIRSDTYVYPWSVF
jgi:hypothetical protein